MVGRWVHYQSYSFYQVFRVKWASHYCYRCGTPLAIQEHERIVERTDERGRDFALFGSVRNTLGATKFIHDIYHCPRCDLDIEIDTQLSIENLITSMEKAERYFQKKGYNLSIQGAFETNDGEFVENISDISQIKKVLLCVFLDETNIGVYQSPLHKSGIGEKAYFFSVKKYELIGFIRKLLKNR